MESRLTNAFAISEFDPNDPEAQNLLKELSSALSDITGSSGDDSFAFEDIKDERALMVIARNQHIEAVGCGALRPLSDDIAEIKRMYSKERGAGMAILAFLEETARKLGYKELRLETRRINTRAVAFYIRNGFHAVANYGKYEGRDEAVCFGKKLNS